MKMLTRHFLLFAFYYSVVVSMKCFRKNPKLGEVHPSVQLEVITKEIFPQNNGSRVTIRCKATAPETNSNSYNPILLNPTVINFFFNEKNIPVENCSPSSNGREKMCELVISKFEEEDIGKYYCMARNEIRCTTMGIDIPSSPCPASGKAERKSYHYKLAVMIKCLKEYTACCITGSDCNHRYYQCLQNL